MFPEKTKNLILIDTEAFFDLKDKAKEYEEFADKDAAKALIDYYTTPNKQTAQNFAAKCVPLFTNKSHIIGDLYKHCSFREGLDEHFKKHVLSNYNLLNELEAVKAKVLYISGTSNPHHSAKNAKITAKALKNSQVTLKLIGYDGINPIGFSTVDTPELAAKMVMEHINLFLGYKA